MVFIIYSIKFFIAPVFPYECDKFIVLHITCATRYRRYTPSVGSKGDTRAHVRGRGGQEISEKCWNGYFI